jgi:hypothetical protein
MISTHRCTVWQPAAAELAALDAVAADAAIESDAAN